MTSFWRRPDPPSHTQSDQLALTRRNNNNTTHHHHHHNHHNHHNHHHNFDRSMTTSDVAAPEQPAAAKPGPQIYLHFEFGLSYSPRNEGKKHAMTYKTRNWRDKANDFPRQVPPPTTNYLQNYEPQQEVQQQRRLRDQAPQLPQLPRHAPLADTSESHTQPHQQPAPILQPSQMQNVAPAMRSPGLLQAPPVSRSPRPEGRSSPASSVNHERGRSAPPPLSANPWDAEPEPMGCSALPTPPPRRSRGDIWKALPTAPSNPSNNGPAPATGFQLPWAEARRDSGSRRRDSRPIPPNTPTVLPVRAPSDPRTAGKRDDPGRRQELEDLSMAMVTVDNGFEGQWWYQGRRQAFDRSDTGQDLPDLRERRSLDAMIPTTSAMAGMSPSSDYASPPGLERSATSRSVGWAVQQDFVPTLNSANVNTFNSAIEDWAATISPLSESESPQRFGRINRRLTTRSDELFLP